MVVATTMAGWAWRKPSQGTAGITSSEWGLPCLLHTPPPLDPPSSFCHPFPAPPPSVHLRWASMRPHMVLWLFHFHFVFHLRFFWVTSEILCALSPLIEVIKSLGDCLSHYFRIGVSIASVYMLSWWNSYPAAGFLSTLEMRQGGPDFSFRGPL